MCEYLGMKLAEWTRPNEGESTAAYRWLRHGTMPVLARRLPSGALLADPQKRVIVVDHRDRLTRFGVEHPEATLSARAARSWSPIPARPATTWCGT
jgi:predicted site-specific integrase-resolvase